MIAGLYVPDCSDDLKAVDGVAASSAVTKYLPVFESAMTFDAGPDAAVFSPMLIADDPAGAVASGCGDRVDFAVAAVAEYFSVAGESMRDDVAGDDDVVAVAGPAAADRDDGAGENLGVDAAPIVLGWRGDRLIVHRNDRLGDALITYRREAAMTITPGNAPAALQYVEAPQTLTMSASGSTRPAQVRGSGTAEALGRGDRLTRFGQHHGRRAAHRRRPPGGTGRRCWPTSVR